MKFVIFTAVFLITGILAFGQKREVAVTFDDLPMTSVGSLQTEREMTKKLLQSIKSNSVPAVGFVNEGRLNVRGEREERIKILQLWLDAGLELGNHTFSHISLEKASIEEYQKDVMNGEKITRRLLSGKNMKLRYFRHPFLRTGETVEDKNALDAFLKNRGYTIAPVTIDNNEYIFAYIYAKAKQKGDAKMMREVGEAYVPYMEKIFEFFERLSKESFGYEIKQTLLLHANELNADYFDELAVMIKRRGYLFVTLEEALKDRTYSLPDAQVNKGLSWIHRWRLAKNLPLKNEPQEPEFITQLFNKLR